MYSRLWEREKPIHIQNQMKPCGSWRYIDVLRQETIGLCEKLTSIYIVFYLWYTAMSDCHNILHETSQPPLAHRYIYVDVYVDPYVSRPIETVANEASTYIYIYLQKVCIVCVGVCLYFRWLRWSALKRLMCSRWMEHCVLIWMWTSQIQHPSEDSSTVYSTERQVLACRPPRSEGVGLEVFSGSFQTDLPTFLFWFYCQYIFVYLLWTQMVKPYLHGQTQALFMYEM